MKRIAICLVALAGGVGLFAAVFAGGARGRQKKPGLGTAAQKPIAVPPDFPSWRFESLRPAPPGLLVVTFSDPADDRPWVIVFDDEGVPRWGYNPDTRALWGQILADGDLVWARSFGDGYGLDPRM